jgi:hypothetical protein
LVPFPRVAGTVWVVTLGTRRLKTWTEFMRLTAGYSLLGHKRKEDSLEELHIDSAGKKLAQ